MFPSKDHLEHNALTNPGVLLRGRPFMDKGNSTTEIPSPVPPGVPIIDSKETRDAHYPIDSIEKGNL